MLRLSLLLILACFTPFAAGAAAEATKSAALIVDTAYQKEAALMRELDLYRNNVKVRFQIELKLHFLETGKSPETIRKGLRQLHDTAGINGALFLGRFPFARFENRSGDVCTMSVFYEDLDAPFEDRDADGLYDFYDPWHAPDRPPIELWIAVIRPYRHDAHDFRSAAEIAAYFAKVNRHLGPDRPDPPQAASIFTSRDWPRLDELTGALRPLYGDGITLTGGLDPTGKGIATTSDQFRELVARPAEIGFIYAHSGVSQHVLDAPPFPGNCILPGVLDAPGRVRLEDLEVNARILSIWGCHALDIENVTYKNGRFLADSYLFTPRFKVLTVLGSARSIGMESIGTFVGFAGERCLSEAWLGYLNHVYSRDYLERWLGVRNVWEKERNGFVWGYLIFGNPFDRIGER